MWVVSDDGSVVVVDAAVVGRSRGGLLWRGDAADDVVGCWGGGSGGGDGG